MEHIAIDLGGRESQICIRSSEGTVREERRLATQELREVFDRPAGRVLLETCTEAFAVAELAMKLGHEVRVVPATLVRSLGVGSHGVKTDVKDARVLSEASCRAGAEAEVEKLAEASEVCRRLMTVPGVGPQTALRFVAALDVPERFMGAHQVESYLGLTPGENSSSDRKRRTSITKAGSTEVRWLLVQASWSALRTRKVHPMLEWARDVAKRRGKRIGTVALARKLAGILYALWRGGTTYQADRAAKKIEG